MSELAALPARTVLGDGLLPVGADGPPCPRRYSSHLDFHNNAPCDKTLQQIQGDQERLDPGLRPCIAAGDNRYAQRIHTGEYIHRTASCIVHYPRSEERRVGKGCVAGSWRDPEIELG